jgi:hypothetical protein
MGIRGMHIWYWWESEKERYHQEDQNIDGLVILNFILTEIGWGSMNWINLAQDRDQWRVLVNTVMNLRFYKILRNS